MHWTLTLVDTSEKTNIHWTLTVDSRRGKTNVILHWTLTVIGTRGQRKGVDLCSDLFLSMY